MATAQFGTGFNMGTFQVSVDSAAQRGDLEELIELLGIYTNMRRETEDDDAQTSMGALLSMIEDRIARHLAWSGPICRDEYQRTGNPGCLLVGLKRFHDRRIPYAIKRRKDVAEAEQVLQQEWDGHHVREARQFIEALLYSLECGERIYCEDGPRYTAALKAGCLAAVIRFVHSKANWSEMTKQVASEYATSRDMNVSEFIADLGNRTVELERLQRKLERQAAKEAVEQAKLARQKAAEAAEAARKRAVELEESRKKQLREDALKELQRRCPQAVPFAQSFFAHIDTGNLGAAKAAKWQIEKRDNGLCPPLRMIWSKFLQERG